MKKVFSVLLLISLLLTCFVGCSLPQKEDVWDGTVATSFAKGVGTENKPFIIEKASQLAFLAQQVNSGVDYSGKHFALACDLDLNDLEWTPIGNGIHAFMGFFDGKGHTIKNLKISQSIYYNYEYPTGKKAGYRDSGLFATAQDAIIRNLKIDSAIIKIADANGGFASVGVLCGTLRTYQSISVISNINIKNATIMTDFTTDKAPLSLEFGGAVGKIYAYNNTTTTISLIETDSIFSFEKGYSSINSVGTILGRANVIDSVFNMENCVAYQTLSVSPEQYYYTVTNDFCGAIGNAQASAKPFTVKNVFSKLTLNKPALESVMTVPAAIISHAIIGEAYYFAVKDDLDAIGYKFENVFGCVEHVDIKTGEKKILTDLYVLPEGPTFSQINCQGCESLPENHGFDTAIWNLTDLAKPKLK